MRERERERERERKEIFENSCISSCSKFTNHEILTNPFPLNWISTLGWFESMGVNLVTIGTFGNLPPFWS